MAHGATLPIKPETGGKVAEGYCTPKADQLPQRMLIPPKRVLPIVFLPGIMGTNLRMSKARQERMEKSNNVAWRPESNFESVKLANASPETRQLQLDPKETEVDTYDPTNNPTGDKKETAYQRHDNVKTGSYYLNVGIDTPLLTDDFPTAKNPKTKEQKARERGWGEIFYDSYRQLLEMCELNLNAPFMALAAKGTPTLWWEKQILGVSPKTWQATPTPALAPLDETMLKEAVTGCWFPVHAMGYNWLKSNKDSGKAIAARIDALIKRYTEQGFQCEKVIVVTHSMGGLVARALIHPAMGNLKDKVLGMVHGVMPATGAGAGYKRMRCGFEGGKLDVASKVCGNLGSEVTAVLGNAQGGLELLPSRAYGNEWLQVRHKNDLLLSLPRNGDPYEEIYKVRNKWYGLLNDEKWLNPAHLDDNGIELTHRLLDGAKAFHNAIAGTFHEQSYAHYGNDFNHRAWHHVIWDISLHVRPSNIDDVTLTKDSLQGELDLNDPTGQSIYTPMPPAKPRPHGVPVPMKAVLRAAAEAGDQTVPFHSADSQYTSGKFKGIFRQTGYEHQASYSNENALRSTLYSIVQIARTMTWTK
jgi:pimeloyl-ACP methyl ester carboxylesterase